MERNMTSILHNHFSQKEIDFAFLNVVGCSIAIGKQLKNSEELKKIEKLPLEYWDDVDISKERMKKYFEESSSFKEKMEKQNDKKLIFATKKDEFADLYFRYQYNI